MITAEELIEQQNLLKQRIYDRGVELGYEEIEPIADGVADIHAYLSKTPRVMWILKEAYDEEGGWSRPDLYNQMNYDKLCESVVHGNPNGGPVPTYYKMIYVMEGLRNKGLQRKDMEHYSKLCGHLLDIAYINVNKMPAENGAQSDSDITGLYENWREITNEQIKLYEPQVIIFGMTFQYFKQEFPEAINVSTKEDYEAGKLTVYKYKDLLLIDAYHPQVYSNAMINGMIDSIHRHLA